MALEGGLGGVSQGLRRGMSDLCRQSPRSKRGSFEEYSNVERTAPMLKIVTGTRLILIRDEWNLGIESLHHQVNQFKAESRV